jgi:transporter family protein
MDNLIYLVLIIAVIWGVVPVFFKYIIKHKDLPFYLILFIQPIIFLFIIISYIILYKRDVFIKDIYEHRNYVYLLILSSILIFTSKVLYLYALKMGINVSVMTIILTLYPVITIILAYLFLRENLPFNALIGFMFIVIGMIFIFYK